MQATFEISIERESFKRAFALAAKALPNGGSPKEILHYVRLLKPSGESDVRLYGTDLEVSCEALVGTSVDGDEMRCLLHGERVGRWLSFAKGPDIVVSCNGNSVELKSGNRSLKFETPRPDEYPAVQQASGERVVVQVQQLARRLSAVARGADEDSTKYALGGVRLESGKGEIDIIGTDGRMMIHEALPVAEQEEFEAMASLRFVQLVSHLASLMTGDGTAGLSCDRSSVYLQSGLVQISGRQIEGRFPMWRDVIDKRYAGIETFIVSVASFIEMVRLGRVAEVKKQGKEPAEASIVLNVEGGSLRSRVRTQRGEIHDEIAITDPSGDAEMWLGMPLLADALAAMPEADVEVEACGEDAVRLRSGSARAMIMQLAKG